MTEGESFIKEYLQGEKIKFRPQQPIDGLQNDSKAHRVADFYLPQYGVYLEYFGQWGIDLQKDRYREKKSVYLKNQIPCVLLYPENLGILNYVFEKRMIYILKRYKLEKELRRYRYKLLFKHKEERFLFISFGLCLFFSQYPWKNDAGVWAIGLALSGYQVYRFARDYKKIFKD